MAKLWTSIVLPLAVAGSIAYQTVGVEASRVSRVSAYFPAHRTDTVKTQPRPDTTLLHKPDSLEEEEFFLFGAEEDTLPRVFARDTMRVPDSLQYTNPFLYQWYVATKDSYTHKVVVDSLKAEGDSTIWPRRPKGKSGPTRTSSFRPSAAGRIRSATTKTVSSASRTASPKTRPASWKPPSCRMPCCTSAWLRGSTTAFTTAWKCLSGTPPPTTTSTTILS